MNSNTESLIDSLVEDTCPVKVIACPYWRFSLWLTFAIAYVLAIVLVCDIRPDLSIKVSQEIFVIELIAVTLVVLSSLLSCAFLCVPDNYNKNWISYFPFIFFIGLSAVIACLFFSQYLDPNYVYSPIDSDSTFKCALEIFLFSVPPAISSIYLMKKGAPTKTYTSALCVALCSTGASYIALRLVEANDDAVHIIIWHYVPILIFTSLLAVNSKNLLRW